MPPKRRSSMNAATAPLPPVPSPSKIPRRRSSTVTVPTTTTRRQSNVPPTPTKITPRKSLTQEDVNNPTPYADVCLDKDLHIIVSYDN